MSKNDSHVDKELRNIVASFKIEDIELTDERIAAMRAIMTGELDAGEEIARLNKKYDSTTKLKNTGINKQTGNPYYIDGSDGHPVQKNMLGITTSKELQAAEADFAATRTSELSAMPIDGHLDHKHFKDTHKHIFQDVYKWAGKERTIQTEKGHRFEFPENIKKNTTKLLSDLRTENHLQGLNKPSFIERAAHYFAELNAIHPFPDGNGRAQRQFFTDIGKKASYEFLWQNTKDGELIEAAIHSFAIDNSKLESMFEHIVFTTE